MIRRTTIAPAAPFAVLATAWLMTALRVITPAAVHAPWLLYWANWQDQTLYVRSASAFARGNLAASEHWYPLLYPLLGTPFVAWWPSQPFFLANIACYLIAFEGFRRVAAVFGITRWPAALIFAATSLTQFVFAKTWIEPWTTTASAALLWLAFGMAASLWTETNSRLKRHQAALLGIAVAFAPFARPADAPIALLAGLFGLAAMLRTRDRGALAAAIIGGAAALGVMAVPYLLVYGAAPSPYMAFSAQYGFNFGWLGWKAYVILVDPRAWFGDGDGLLEHAPWLILGAAGLVQACCLGPRERRVPAAVLCAAAALYLGMILAYVDLLPTGLWRYNNVHYFKWLLPLFGLFAVRFVMTGIARPTSLAFILPFLLLLMIRIVPVPVGPDAPARLVLFSEPPGSEWSDLYFATAWIDDRRGEQRNSFDYHQLIDRGRVRAVALRRPFAGDERWIGSDHVRAQLNGTATGAFAPLYLTGPWPRQPLRRYDARVTFGLPRWLLWR